MSVMLLTEHHLEFLSLKGGCAGSSESTLVKCHIVGNHMSRLICMSESFVSHLTVLGELSLHFSSNNGDLLLSYYA